MSVYFIRAATTPPTIKIGYSAHVSKRVEWILRKCPEGSAFLGYLPGQRDLERHFHYLFRRQRILGEWFEESEDLLRLIADYTIKHMPGKEYATMADKLRHIDLTLAREASDTLSEIVIDMGQGTATSEVVKHLAPAMGLTEARFLAILNCEIDSLTGAEHAQISIARQFMPQVLASEPTAYPGMELTGGDK